MSKFVKYCPRLMMLSYAVLPATGTIDWLYCSVAALAIVLFVVLVAYAIYAYRTDREHFVSRVFGGKWECIYDLIISMVGIIVGYSFGNNAATWFWAIFLLLSTAELTTVLTRKYCTGTNRHSN